MNAKALIEASVFEAISRNVEKVMVEVLESWSRAPRVWLGDGNFQEHWEEHICSFCLLKCSVCEAAR